MINYELYVRPQVAGIPPIYLPMLQAIKYTKGIPISWLAALCEQTEWNANFKVDNVFWGTTPWPTVRRFGLAGVWGDIPELPQAPGPVWPGCATYYHAGWFPVWSCYGVRCTMCKGCYSAAYMSYDTNLNIAADILNESASYVQAKCGELNSLIFLRYIIGCKYIPEPGLDGKCTVPPDLPAFVTDSVNAAVAAQALYAEQLGETPIVPPTMTVVLSATPTLVQPNAPVSFSAQVTGGASPYSYTWTFGDGASTMTTGPTASYSYGTEGSYAATVIVTDSEGASASSSPLSINVSLTAPAGGGNGLLLAGLAGLLGLVGLVGLASRKTPEGKRQQAARLRNEAARLRQEAASLRAQGKTAQAQQKELQASNLEQRASELERQAAQEETARLYQEGQPAGTRKAVR